MLSTIQHVEVHGMIIIKSVRQLVSGTRTELVIVDGAMYCEYENGAQHLEGVQVDTMARVTLDVSCCSIELVRSFRGVEFHW